MNGTSVIINFAIFQADAFEADRTKERVVSTHMYRLHTSLQCVLIAQETVAQNGQAEGCVFLLTQLYSYLCSPWIK
jgi:hypothetical protein